MGGHYLRIPAPLRIKKKVFPISCYSQYGSFMNSS